MADRGREERKVWKEHADQARAQLSRAEELRKEMLEFFKGQISRLRESRATNVEIAAASAVDQAEYHMRGRYRTRLAKLQQHVEEEKVINIISTKASLIEALIKSCKKEIASGRDVPEGKLKKLEEDLAKVNQMVDEMITLDISDADFLGTHEADRTPLSPDSMSFESELGDGKFGILADWERSDVDHMMTPPHVE